MTEGRKKGPVYRLPLTEARNNLGKVVKRAHLNKEIIVLEKDGIPLAAILNFADLEDYLELKDTKMINQIAEGYTAYKSGDVLDARDLLKDLGKKSSAQKKGNKRSKR